MGRPPSIPTRGGLLGGTKGKGVHAFSVFVTPPLSTVKKMFKSLGWKMSKPDFRQAWQEFAPDMAAAVEEIWSTKGAAANQAWPDYRPMYAKYRKGGSSTATLIVTGTLHNAVTRVGKGKGSIRKMRKKSMVWGTNLPQSRDLNYGRFRFLWITEAMKTKAGEAIARHIERMIDQELSSMSKAMLATRGLL